MRKALLIIAFAAALAVPAVSAAGSSPPGHRILCGGSCDGGGTGGWTGCTQQTVADSGGIPYLARYRHYLVVSYCKQNGVITSTSTLELICATSSASSVGSYWPSPSV